MYKFIWLVPLLPLAGAAINGIFGRWFRFPEKLVGGIAVASVALSFLISVAAIYSYGFSGNALWPSPYVSTQTAFIWIPAERSGPRWESRPRDRKRRSRSRTSRSLSDQIAVRCLTLNGVINSIRSPQFSCSSSPAWPVHLCLRHRLHAWRHRLLSVLRLYGPVHVFHAGAGDGSNFVMMFVGWEGVGLCSYLLIGYYFNREEAANASRKAFITNRIGDFGFILAILR